MATQPAMAAPLSRLTVQTGNWPRTRMALLRRVGQHRFCLAVFVIWAPNPHLLCAHIYSEREIITAEKPVQEVLNASIF